MEKIKKFFDGVWNYLNSTKFTRLVAFINLAVFFLTWEDIWLIFSLLMVILYRLEILDEKVDNLLMEEVVDDEKG